MMLVQYNDRPSWHNDENATWHTHKLYADDKICVSALYHQSYWNCWPSPFSNRKSNWLFPSSSFSPVTNHENPKKKSRISKSSPELIYGRGVRVLHKSQAVTLISPIALDNEKLHGGNPSGHDGINNVVMTFWRNNSVIITSCVRLEQDYVTVQITMPSTQSRDWPTHKKKRQKKETRTGRRPHPLNKNWIDNCTAIYNLDIV